MTDSRDFAALTNQQRHDAFPPSTWTVAKAAERLWKLVTPDGVVITYTKTKREALAECEDGFFVRHWEKERRWYAGEHVQGWKPYAAVLAERAGFRS